VEYGSAEDQPPGDYNDSFASTGDVALDKLKIPPHSIEAEQSVIGGLMLSPETWDSISDTLVEGDFYRREHRLIFRTMSSLVEIQSPLDVITLSEALQSRAELDNVGGLSYLGELATNTPSIANIKAYADIIRERSTLRQLIGAATDTAEDCFYPEGREAGELLSDAEQRISNIAEGRPKIGGPQDANSLLKSTIEKIDELFNTDGSLTGLTTGFKDIDEQTSGLQNSDLIIVAARPSMGKTALAMNLVENAIMAQDKPVIVFSMEMPAESLIMRMLSSIGRINQTRIRSGNLTEEDWPKLSAAVSKLKDKPLFIDDTAALSPGEIRSRCKRIQREHGSPAMIMIDYLQLMQVPGKENNRVEEISYISRSLKTLAKEFECPVVALSQLNRGLEQRPNKRPVNSDLRESGAIEQDADVIAFIYRDEVYNEDSPDKGVAEIIIGKQRNGPIGTSRLAFIGEFTRFEDLAFGANDYNG
jgi:replicative DNA helicase|tara:strand:- start:28307 stop:29731 length:1425 start_codon:yes stop_codon:yes gene_type:complete